MAPTLTIRQRIERHIEAEPNSGCWLWTGAVRRRYGCFNFGDGHSTGAHRASFTAHGRTIPDGLQLDHLCRTTLCVNPDHLEAVSLHENMARRPSSNSRNHNSFKTKCKHGHTLDGARGGSEKGYRYCKTCTYVKNAKARLRRSAISLASN